MGIKIRLDLAEKLAERVIQDITYTADAGSGASGNLISIVYVDPAGNNQLLAVSVIDTAITVSLATDGVGAITSTATLIQAAVDIHGAASALVDAVVTGVGATVQTANPVVDLLGGRNEGTFDKGSPFYGINPKKAIVSISTGKIAEGWVKILSSGRSDPDGVKDGTSSLKVGRTGLEMTDVQFHYIINSSESFMTFGVQIVSLVEMGHIEVLQNGAPLTVAQIRAFTA